ncbi:MAG: type 4a pilus biogenesis protein PilO [Candidatus Thiodiazotropha endolucinida]
MTRLKLPVRVAYAIRNRHLQIGSTVFISCLLFFLWQYFGHLRVWEHQLEEKFSEFKLLQNDIVKLKNDLQNNKRYNDAFISLNKLENRLSSQSSQVTLIGHINDLAKLSGVHVKASTFRHGKSDRGVMRSHQEIELSGQYTGLREFIKGLTSLPTLTVPVETKVEREQDTRKIKARIHLVSYQSSDDSEDRR